MSPHRIHLRGPWIVRALVPPASSQGQTVERRVTMPADWASSAGPSTSLAIFERRFQWPTVLEPDERAWLVFEGLGGQGSVALNETRIGDLDSQPTRFDITDSLRSTNLLRVELEFAPAPHCENSGGLWGLVLLEIYDGGSTIPDAEIGPS